jgi:hypothetical protein
MRQDRLEQLAHNAVREGLLQLTSASLHHGHVGVPGARARRGQERRLADTRVALERDEPSCARPRRHNGSVHRRKLLGTLEQNRPLLAPWPRRARLAEGIRQAFDRELEQLLGCLEARQAHLTQVLEADTGG